MKMHVAMVSVVVLLVGCGVQGSVTTSTVAARGDKVLVECSETEPMSDSMVVIKVVMPAGGEYPEARIYSYESVGSRVEHRLLTTESIATWQHEPAKSKSLFMSEDDSEFVLKFTRQDGQRSFDAEVSNEAGEYENVPFACSILAY